MKYKFTTTLDQQLIDQLKIQAVNEHRSVANILEELVQNYLKQHSSHD
ncbi:hypothetical protein [Limosilactobacillus fermentum]|nr:hypothetical protein [Limosilactobacillus fermentum]MCD5422955.1 hypothetical protein [Limosilactobacillus fermentum]